MEKNYQKSVASIESTDEAKFGANGGFTAVLSTPSLDRDGDRLFRDEWLDLPEWLPLDVDHGMSMQDTVGKFHPYWDGDRMLMDAYFASTPRAQETRTLLNDLRDEATNTWPVGVSVAFMTDKSKKDGEARRELLNAGIVAIPSNRDAVLLASKAAHALQDAFSATSEGDGLAEVRQVVMDVLVAPELKDISVPSGPGCGCCGNCEAESKSTGTVYINVEPKIDYEKFVKQIADGLKAEGGGDTALKQAIHDASVHLGAVCFPLVTNEDPSGESEGANKSLTVISQSGQEIGFDSLGEAKEFATELLDSITSAVDELVHLDLSVKSDNFDLEALKPEGLSMEQFESALKTMLTPSEDETPETPEPAEEAASAVSAESKSDVTHAGLMRMRAALRLQKTLEKETTE